MDTKNLDIYGSEPIPWTRVLKQLEAGDLKGSFWLATSRPDGRPHVAGVGAIWVDGKLYFVSGASTRKSQNLAQHPGCSLSVSLPDIDLAVEGTAAIVRDETTVARLAERYAAQGWPAEARDGAPYSAIQRSQRGTGAVGSVRVHDGEGDRRSHVRAAWRDPMELGLRGGRQHPRGILDQQHPHRRFVDAAAAQPRHDGAEDVPVARAAVLQQLHLRAHVL